MLHLFKFILAVSIFVLSLVTGLAPFRISSHSQLWIKVTGAFSSGIFIGAAMLHLLPSAVTSWQRLVASSYPWIYLICIGTALLLTMIERSLPLKAHDHSNCSHPHTETSLCLLLLVALHSLIEGAAIGLPNNRAESLIIFLAVLAHKGAESFAVGHKLKDLGMTSTVNHYLIILFSLITPAGIMLASSITSRLSGNYSNYLLTIFNAVTAGTFLYLGVEHLLEGDKEYRQRYELLGLGLALSVMALLAVYG